MRTLLIDNYDSFTYNLFQLLAEVNGVEPIVVRNDEAGWEDVAAEGFDAVVLSPGPGRPDREGDFGLCAAAIGDFEGPLLGVCLGHQGIGLAYGGAVEPAPEPVHGRLSTVTHSGAPLFAGIPSRFEAVRYHSLCLARPLPAGLEEIAWSEDGVPMAVAHRTRPQWGVQFHPESVAAEHGRRLLENFRDLAAPAEPGTLLPPGRVDFPVYSLRKSTRRAGAASRRLELRTRRLDRPHAPERVFSALYSESSDAFWLDSSCPDNNTRFSFMGDAGGPLGAVVSYDVDGRQVTVERGGGSRRGAPGEPGAVEVRAETILDYLACELERLPAPDADLPFDFQCGFAGYLGYELKADCGGDRAHSSPRPDAAFLFADRMIAFDHEENCVFLLCLHEREEEKSADEWLSATESHLLTLAEQVASGETEEGPVEPPRCCSTGPSSVSPHLARSEQTYLADIEECKRLLREGETYEVCLTNSFEVDTDANPLDLYRELRRVNPAPFSSYLRFGDLAVLGSSPERFLRVDREQGVEAKPIKGTAPRGETAAEDALIAEQLAADEKSRAENLMIADLLRNDLGRVCEIGSVRVPALMEVESYATVHQLVTTVAGRLRPQLDALDAVRACFPPGSMTGAPKLRTMRILDRLEGRARGVYSGAIGWFGPGGACDLSVTIRTVVLDRGTATIGTGGAIVAQSDPGAEYEEMLLKARAPVAALAGVTAAAALSAPFPAA
jgi:para-aminobenzoate synthetase